MEEIREVLNLNFKEVIIGIVAILIGIRVLVDLISWICDKAGIELRWVEDKKKDHKKLMEICKEVDTMKKVQVNEVSSATNEALRLKDNINDLSAQLTDVMNAIIEIRKSIDSLKETTKINSEANVELLYQKINEKCDYYINVLQGIPNDEYMVLQTLFEKYAMSGGNHGLHKKVDYCLNNLPIIPEKQL